MSSSQSLRLIDIVDESLPSLLSESLTMSSIDSDVDPVPSYPTRPLCPIPPFISAKYLSAVEPDIFVTVSTPTVPRLAKVIHEPVCVMRWLECILPTPPPGDIPWGGVWPTKPEIWRPTGSLYSPADFQKALRSARNHHSACTLPVATAIKTNSTSQKASHRRTSIREGLVLKREPIVRTVERDKRLSLQMPATNVDSEIVDIMLELQDLNSFFKNGLEDLENSVATLNQEKSQLQPPSLIVSDSHTTLPVVLEHPSNPASEPSVPLAMRRGKGLLPPLSIVSANQSSYPSIPSAFMGSPSTSSPKFHQVQAENHLSLGFEDMIATLKSECNYPQQDATPRENSEPVDSPTSVISFASPSENEDDDWAFATSLLTEFGTDASDIISRMNIANVHGLSSDNVNIATESAHTPTKESLPSTANQPQKPNASPCPPLSPAPTSPLPSTPPATPASAVPPTTPVTPTAPATPHSPTPPNGVRGILKSCKNVRFASLPEKPANFRIESITPPSPPLTPPISNLRRPLRSRTTHRDSKVITDTAPPSILLQESNLRTQTGPPRWISQQGVGNGLPLPLPLSPVDPSFSPKTPSPLSRTISPPRVSARDTIPARKSLSLVRTTKPERNKENEVKIPAPTPRTGTSLRWTMNDVTFSRRSSNVVQPPESTSKSRMPVPLRNIFRFK